MAGTTRRQQWGDEARTVGMSLVVGRALGTVVVTLRGELDGSGSAYLAAVLDDLIDGQGNLNDWDPTATPFHKQGNQRRAALTVPSGRRYAFRYLGQDERWFNDDAADDYESNGYGGQNGVIDLVQAR